ncbi:GAF domain-containing protein [Epibacterium ulvae]|nr:GAF domain-containing protein [Epibacterium ulvae]
MDKTTELLSVAATKLQANYVTVSIPDLSPEALPMSLRIGIFATQSGDLRWVSIPGAGTFCARVMRESSPLTVSCLSESEQQEACTLLQDTGPFAYLGVPIPAVTGGSIGTLAAQYKGERVWSQANADDAEHTARQIGFEMLPLAMRDGRNLV